MERCPVIAVDDGSPGFAFSAYHFFLVQTLWLKPTSQKRASPACLSLPTFVWTEWARNWEWGEGGIQTSTLKSEGNDWSRSIGLLTVASVKTPTWYWGLVIWRNCETRLCAGYGHRNVRFRRSFNYDASKRNNRLRHMPLKQLHIYPQAWAIQTAKTWGQVMGNSNRKLFTLTAFTSAFQMSERCSYDS